VCVFTEYLNERVFVVQGLVGGSYLFLFSTSHLQSPADIDVIAPRRRIFGQCTNVVQIPYYANCRRLESTINWNTTSKHVIDGYDKLSTKLGLNINSFFLPFFTADIWN